MPTSRDNSGKLPQKTCHGYQKGNKKHQPSLSFFQISFHWDPRIASLSTTWVTLFTQRGLHGLHCQDTTKPHLQSCWRGLVWSNLRSWTGREAVKAAVRNSSWRDKTGFYLDVWWYARKTKKFWGPATVCWSRMSRNLPQSMLWRRKHGGSPLLFNKIKLLFMGEKHFPLFQFFNTGRLRSCAALNELSHPKQLESAWVYMPWLPLCHLDMFKITSWKGFHSQILRFHQEVVLITMVQSSHYFARELW